MIAEYSVEGERCRSETRLQDAVVLRTSLDFVRLPWYWHRMIKSSRNLNCMHMTRFGWAVRGVAR